MPSAAQVRHAELRRHKPQHAEANERVWLLSLQIKRAQPQCRGQRLVCLLEVLVRECFDDCGARSHEDQTCGYHDDEHDDKEEDFRI